MNLTPFMIELLLHFNCRAVRHECEDSDAGKEAVKWMTMENLIIPRFSEGRALHETTERGAALVNMLCKTPLPVRVQSWEDPRQPGSQ